jgi:hypothetical protein
LKGVHVGDGSAKTQTFSTLVFVWNHRQVTAEVCFFLGSSLI